MTTPRGNPKEMLRRYLWSNRREDGGAIVSTLVFADATLVVRKAPRHEEPWRWYLFGGIGAAPIDSGSAASPIRAKTEALVAYAHMGDALDETGRSGSNGGSGDSP